MSMDLSQKNIGIAITGSYCTYKKVFAELEKLASTGAICIRFFPIMLLPLTAVLENVLTFLSRQKKSPERNRSRPFRMRNRSDRGPFLTFSSSHRAPAIHCQNLANGISDTPVLMAAKAHLRNNRPLVVALSTNDALGMNLKNIGFALTQRTFILFHLARIITNRNQIP